MIFTKGAYQSAKFQIFDCSGGISPNLYFDRLLLMKAYKISYKKVERSYMYLMILKSDAKFEEQLICYFKNDKNLVNFDPSTQKSKKSTLWLIPFVQSWTKKKEKRTCGLENDTRNLANFRQNTLRCQNLCFDGVFLSKLQNSWAKNLQRS